MRRQLGCAAWLVLSTPARDPAQPKGKGSSVLAAQLTLGSANRNAALQYPQLAISAIWETSAPSPPAAVPCPTLTKGARTESSGRAQPSQPPPWHVGRHAEEPDIHCGVQPGNSRPGLKIRVVTRNCSACCW